MTTFITSFSLVSHTGLLYWLRIRNAAIQSALYLCSGFWQVQLKLLQPSSGRTEHIYFILLWCATSSFHLRFRPLCILSQSHYNSNTNFSSVKCLLSNVSLAFVLHQVIFEGVAQFRSVTVIFGFQVLEKISMMTSKLLSSRLKCCFEWDFCHRFSMLLYLKWTSIKCASFCFHYELKLQ